MTKQMDDKAFRIFNHYKYLIEKNSFDEYDIWGFLILIRNYIDKIQYRGIFEFCNLIAHRNRDRGIVMECIEKAITNNYATLPDSKAVMGYQGIAKERWEKEWSLFATQYDVSISKQAMADLMLCMFSLAQDTEYSSLQGAGKIVVFQGKNGVLSLVTTEGLLDSQYVCFSQFGPYKFLYEYSAGKITDVVETKRVGTELQLYAGDLRII